MRRFLLTALCVLLSLCFGFWGIQTAWIGSLPGQNPSDYEIPATVQLGLGVFFLLVPVALWLTVWKKKRTNI